jgi:hypothetical protein
MNDIIASALVMIFGVICLALVLRSVGSGEQRVLGLSFVAHMVSSVFMILLTVYFFGGGDMLAYQREGILLSNYLDSDFVEYAPDLLRYALGRPLVEHHFFMSESATGTMIGISTWFMFAMRGSLYGACMLIGVFSFLSKFIMYRGLCATLPSRYHMRALWASTMMPSVVFWSSGLLKEPIAMIGLGPAVWGMAQLIQGPRRAVGLVALVLGSLPIALIKPYILFPFLLCSGVWFYWHRSLSSKGKVAILKQPLYILLAGVLSVGGVQALSVIFPEFGVENLADEAAGLQEMGQRIEGGSHYRIAVAPSRSLVGQLLIAPIGLSFALFRPLPFDVRNPVILLSALEMMGIMWLWWRIARMRSWRQTLKIIYSSPILVFCIAFCVIFGAAVGVSSTNIGTLSRYRVPMMPFYLLALLVLSLPHGAKTIPARRALGRSA